MSEAVFNSLIFGLGLVLLVYSADWLIQGAVKLSRLFKLSPLFIGLVVVAFGTSAPEAGVGVVAALRNQKGIALGNVIGSNIANIGLVLGTCAFIRPLAVDRRIFKRELPLLLGSVALLYALSLDLTLSRLDGVILLSCFLFFLFISYRGARSGDIQELDGFKFKRLLARSNQSGLIFIITGLSLLGVIWGADLMVKGGSRLAALLGITPWIIGITIFAIGTSLPELAASLMASLKKAGSISVGNVVGSNIFNILLVLGLVTLIRPIQIDASILRFELPVLFLFSLAAVIIMKTGYKITRWEGLAMFLGYLTFLVVLVAR